MKIIDKNVLEIADLKVGHTYRAKRPKMTKFGEINDRIIVAMTAGQVQYDGSAVGLGRKYPLISVDKFLKWAAYDINDPNFEAASKRKEQKQEERFKKAFKDTDVLPPEPNGGYKTMMEEYQAICRPYRIPGRDHASLLLYLQTRETDYNGFPDDEHMRSKRRDGWSEDYSSRKWDGRMFEDHDDYDTMYDLEELELLVDRGTGLYPNVRLTKTGHELVGKLIAVRSKWDFRE